VNICTHPIVDSREKWTNSRGPVRVMVNPGQPADH
jgi:hypothetical protein